MQKKKSNLKKKILFTGSPEFYFLSIFSIKKIFSWKRISVLKTFFFLIISNEISSQSCLGRQFLNSVRSDCIIKLHELLDLVS